jgi:hypothetical protein
LNTHGVRLWHTFLGSSGGNGRDIVVDGNGNVYVAGESEATWGSPVNAHAGYFDAFVAKLNTDGIILWNTFLGSSSFESGLGIAVDSSGNVYVAGESEATWGSPVNAYAGNKDTYVAKLNTNGARLWNTFMGSSDDDNGRAIAVDDNGNSYVVGDSDATWGVTIDIYTENALQGFPDVFVAKLNTNGVRLWNTFMGSSEEDYGRGIAVSGAGNVHVAGSSHATWGTPITTHAGDSYDVFAAKLSTNGTILWNTFMGSSSGDSGNAIAVDYDGNAYVVGDSDATWGSPSNPFSGGGGEAFAAKLDINGFRIWNTFMGSNIDDFGNDITVDDTGNVYVAGFSYSTWGMPVNTYAGRTDAFVAKLSQNGALYHTLKALGDIDGNSGQDTAVVEQRAVTVKKLNSAVINQFQFDTSLSPVDVEVMADINNNGAPEMVLLGIGSTKGEVRDSLTGQHLGAATFSANFNPIDLEIVPDQNGNQIPEPAR